MTHPASADEVRPHLTEARKSANETYQRRRARSAADMLLEIAPDRWDEHTKRVILVTLPSLIYAQELARYGEPQPHLTCALATCTQDAGHDGEHDPFPAPLRAAWCDYGNESGVCTLPEGHEGDHDPDPDALPPMFSRQTTSGEWVTEATFDHDPTRFAACREGRCVCQRAARAR